MKGWLVSTPLSLLVVLTLALPSPALSQPAVPTAFDIRFCAEVRQYMNWTNANIDAGNTDGLPMMADPLARIDSVDLDCAGRSVSFRHYFERGDSETLRAGLSVEWAREWCRPGVWREAIDFGWAVVDMITFADGARYDVAADCP